MYNWSVDPKEFGKNAQAHTVWKLEQMVNFGLDGQKIKEKELKKYWNTIVIDPARRAFLSLLLYES